LVFGIDTEAIAYTGGRQRGETSDARAKKRVSVVETDASRHAG
jgi:hypothetical protein